MKNPKNAINLVISDKREAVRIYRDRVQEIESTLGSMRKNAKNREQIKVSLDFARESLRKAEGELIGAEALARRISDYAACEDQIQKLVAERNKLCPSMLLQSELRVADRQSTQNK